MSSREISISRALSLALRHTPESFGLSLDSRGWVGLDEAARALSGRRGLGEVTVDDLKRVVAGASKQRCEIRHGRIRAVYGHSVPEPIHHEAAPPPPVLYHGTSPRAAESILSQGLRSMARQRVHMATDVEMATSVGARHACRPVILAVDAAAASADGVTFYPGSDRVWMADAVPAQYLRIVPQG